MKAVKSKLLIKLNTEKFLAFAVHYVKINDFYTNFILYVTLHKKWSFPLRISSAKEEILDGKLHFLYSVNQ